MKYIVNILVYLIPIMILLSKGLSLSIIGIPLVTFIVHYFTIGKEEGAWSWFLPSTMTLFYVIIMSIIR